MPKIEPALAVSQRSIAQMGKPPHILRAHIQHLLNQLGQQLCIAAQEINPKEKWHRG